MRVKVKLKVDPLRITAERAARAPRRMREAFLRQIVPASEKRVEQTLGQEAPTVPFSHFKTDAQRKWFWWQVGIGEIVLPYQRKGIWKNWQHDAQAQLAGGKVTVYNPATATPFVYGPDKQPFLAHWPDAVPTLQYEVAALVNDIRNAWFDVADPFGE